MRYDVIAHGKDELLAVTTNVHGGTNYALRCRKYTHPNYTIGITFQADSMSQPGIEDRGCEKYEPDGQVIYVSTLRW